MNGQMTNGAAPLVDKERRENLFRELDKAQWTGGQIAALVVAVLVGLGLFGAGAAGILLGLLILAACVLIVVKRSQGELTTAPVSDLERTLDDKAADCARDAVAQLRLDPDEDVIQSLILVGGTPRPLIEGRIRSLTGPKPYPMKHWIPWAPSPDPQYPRYCYGRYQVHALFALEDAIAFFTRQYDYVDGDYVREFEDNGSYASGWSTNKIYFRHIENVRMTAYCMQLQMASGRSHLFPIAIQPHEGVNGPMARATSREMAAVNEKYLAAGQHFERAVNQLRDEWERRQVAAP